MVGKHAQSGQSNTNSRGCMLVAAWAESPDRTHRFYVEVGRMGSVGCVAYKRNVRLGFPVIKSVAVEGGVLCVSVSIRELRMRISMPVTPNWAHDAAARFQATQASVMGLPLYQ